MSGINLKKKTVWGVILFLIGVGLFLAHEADASETSYEVSYGATFVGGSQYDSATFFMSEAFDDRKYHVGLLLQTGLDCVDGNRCRGESGGNQAFFVQRVVYFGDMFLGIGGSYWHKQTPAWNSNTPYALSIGYEFNDHLAVTWRHFSTGGSSSINPGLDLVTVRYNF